MNRELTVFGCDNSFNSYNDTNFSETIESIVEVFKEYQEFIASLEDFFNSQLHGNDINLFKEDIFELSDINGDINFPFKKVNDSLQFIETDGWRAVIMAGIINRKTRRKKDEQNKL
jgi:hypothetical protein